MKVVEYNEAEADNRGMGIIHIKCKWNTDIRALCDNVGELCGVRAKMQEVRRVQSGCLGERDNMVTIYDVLDAKYVYDTMHSEDYLRRLVMPLEVMLTN